MLFQKLPKITDKLKSIRGFVATFILNFKLQNKSIKKGGLPSLQNSFWCAYIPNM